MDALGRLATKRNLAAVDAKNSRVTTWRASSCDNSMAWDETEFHKPVRDVLGEVYVIQKSGFVFRQVGKTKSLALVAFSFETQLHLKYTFSIVP